MAKLTKDRARCVDALRDIPFGTKFRADSGEVYTFTRWTTLNRKNEAVVRVPHFQSNRRSTDTGAFFTFAPVHVDTLLNKLSGAVRYVDES